MIKGAVAATTSVGLRAAEEVRLAKGSAADMALAAFFADAGARENALLSPMIAMAVGVGVGARLLDARARQPGLGVERPRGAQKDEDPPLAARVSAPITLMGAVLFQSALGRISLSNVVSEGERVARESGDRRRAALIADVGAMKGAIASSEPYVEALLAVGGRAAGGALSRADLIASAPIVNIDARAADGARVYHPSESKSEKSAITGELEIVAACDAWGLSVVLAYQVPAPAAAVPLPGLQIGAPLAAHPVMRGVQRTPPGAALPLRAPISVIDKGGGTVIAVGAKAARALLIGEPFAKALSIDEAARELGSAITGVTLDARGGRVLGAHAAP